MCPVLCVTELGCGELISRKIIALKHHGAVWRGVKRGFVGASHGEGSLPLPPLHPAHDFTPHPGASGSLDARRQLRQPAASGKPWEPFLTLLSSSFRT